MPMAFAMPFCIAIWPSLLPVSFMQVKVLILVVRYCSKVYIPLPPQYYLPRKRHHLEVGAAKAASAWRSHEASAFNRDPCGHADRAACSVDGYRLPARSAVSHHWRPLVSFSAGQPDGLLPLKVACRMSG